MSESAEIVCPVCRSRLRLRGNVLSKATFPCPKCGTTLDVPKSESPSEPLPRTSSPSSTAPPSKPVRPVAKNIVAKTSPVASKPPAEPPRKRKKSRDEIPDPYGEDIHNAEDDGDFFGSGATDDFSSYGAAEDPYGTPGALPPRKKQRSSQAAADAGATRSSSSRAGAARRGGFLSWVGYGALAAIAGIILQTLLGFTNFLWPLLIATIATGSMVGYAVRHAAGENNGWGPGVVAVLIAAFAILVGRVGAFSMSPDVDKILGIPAAPLTTEEAEARVVKETTEPFLIANIAEEVQYDDDFLTTQNIDSDEASEFWVEHADEEDPAMRYLPAIWNEATRRWNANTPEQKEAVRQSTNMELRESYGIMSNDEVQKRITEATTNDAMIGEIANTLYADDVWTAQAGLTEDQIGEHWGNSDVDDKASGESQHLPAVWTEAKRRWEEMPAEQKQARIKERSDNLRGELVFSAEEAKAVENVGKAVRIVFIVLGAIFTLFWGIGSLLCSVSALVGAFKIASGMNAGK